MDPGRGAISSIPVSSPAQDLRECPLCPPRSDKPGRVERTPWTPARDCAVSYASAGRCQSVSATSLGGLVEGGGSATGLSSGSEGPSVAAIVHLGPTGRRDIDAPERFWRRIEGQQDR